MIFILILPLYRLMPSRQINDNPKINGIIIMIRQTQFQLTQFTKDKVINLKQIDPILQKNIKRLLNQDMQESDSPDDSTGIFCSLYIDPQSNFSLGWAIVFLLFFYIVQMQISLSLAFGPTFFTEQLQFQDHYLYVYIIILIFLAIDIFLTFFKGYYAFGRGKVIDDHNQIISHYIKTQLHFDVIVWVIYIIPLIHVDYGLNFLQLITAGLIWVKKFKYQSQIISYLQYRAGLRASFMLFILFVDVLMIGNYGACIFIGMDILLYNRSYYGDNSAYYWLSNNTSYPNSLIGGPWYVQYVYGQEFATGTLSTLAPGPFAKNPWQAFYAIVIMILFMVLASYVGEVLIQIVYTYTQRRIFHEQNIMSFDNFMQLKAVDRKIRNRIYNFFELIWQVELKMQSKQQQAMINKLPTYLKEELLLQIGFTKSLNFLEHLPHHTSLQKLIALKLERITIDSNTCIFQAQKINSLSTRNIYFIKEGMAKFYLGEHQLKPENSSDKVVKATGREKIISLSNVEKILGVYEFITAQDYSLCCKSIDLSLVQKLTFANFEAIVQQLKIWEQFKEFQHKILIERQMHLIKKTCVVCLQNHMQSECPQLFCSQRFRKELVEQNRLKIDQKRRSVNRRDFKSKKIHESQQDKERMSKVPIFSLFKNINLGQLILDINRLEGWQGLEIQEVTIFNGYYRDGNISSS